MKLDSTFFINVICLLLGTFIMLPTIGFHTHYACNWHEGHQCGQMLWGLAFHEGGLMTIVGGRFHKHKNVNFSFYFTFVIAIILWLYFTYCMILIESIYPTKWNWPQDISLVTGMIGFAGAAISVYLLLLSEKEEKHKKHEVSYIIALYACLFICVVSIYIYYITPLPKSI